MFRDRLTLQSKGNKRVTQSINRNWKNTERSHYWDVCGFKTNNLLEQTKKKQKQNEEAESICMRRKWKGRKKEKTRKLKKKK